MRARSNLWAMGASLSLLASVTTACNRFTGVTEVSSVSTAPVSPTLSSSRFLQMTMKVRKAVVPRELKTSLIYSKSNLNKMFEQDQNENRIQLFNRTNGLLGDVKASRSFVQSIVAPIATSAVKPTEIGAPFLPTDGTRVVSLSFLTAS